MRKTLLLFALLGVIGVVVGVVGFFYLQGRANSPESLAAVAQRRRDLQTIALRRYLARSSGEAILPANAVEIAVREDFLESVLEASLPFRQTFEKGKFVARLDSARVNLTDGLAVVVLTGEGRLASDSTIFANLRVEGTLGIAGLDFTNGQLAPQLVITDVRVLRAGPSQFRAVTNPAVRYFSRRKAREWNDLKAPFHLPLKLESTLKLPRVEGDVTVPETELPLAIRLAAVTSLKDLLVVSLELLPDSSDTSAGALGAYLPAEAWKDSMLVRAGPRLDDVQFALLKERVHAAAGRDTIWQALAQAERDVVILMPQVVLEDLAGRAARRFRQGAIVDFRPELREEIDKEIRIKLLGRKVGAGRIHVDINVRHLRGRLITPGAPDLRFLPPDGLDLDVPIHVSEGGGNATFTAKWDPAALVSVVCKEFETRLALSGTVRPFTHTARATVRFGLVGGKIVGRPRVRRDRIPLSFDLDPASWKKVRAVFEEQDRFGRCGVGINPDSLVEALHRLGRKGVKVRLPEDLIPSFTLPVAFGDSYEEGGVVVDVLAYGPDLVVRRDYLRFGVDADLRVVQRDGQPVSEPSIIPMRRAAP